MAILPGRRPGPDEILTAIGAGGMGKVCQAHDTRPGLDMVIKVLPEAFTHDAERLSRFQWEAKILALLIRPNAAKIRGVETSGRFHFLLMELICGRTN
jgi:eukaryotic-like serine/threonine-protein kinase